jgi:hypothetical protein
MEEVRDIILGEQKDYSFFFLEFSQASPVFLIMVANNV